MEEKITIHIQLKEPAVVISGLMNETQLKNITKSWNDYFIHNPTNHCPGGVFDYYGLDDKPAVLCLKFDNVAAIY